MLYKVVVLSETVVNKPFSFVQYHKMDQRT